MALLTTREMLVDPALNGAHVLFELNCIHTRFLSFAENHGFFRQL
jgi:hypothetical protein